MTNPFIQFFHPNYLEERIRDQNCHGPYFTS